jgi:copper(I)-binding protein
MTSRPLAGLVLALGLLAAPVSAHDYKLGSLEIERPWSRATAPTAPTAGGFLKVVNKGAALRRHEAIRRGASARVEIHEMKMEGSVMRMRELEKGLEIPAGGTVTLAPGGYHLMFMQLKEPFKQDVKVPVTLVFEKAGSIDVEFNVVAMGATPQGMSSGGAHGHR